MRRHFVVLLLLLGTAGNAGCAAMALTVFGSGAGIGAGTGSNYLLDSIVYETFTVPEPGLRVATLRTLKRMAPRPERRSWRWQATAPLRSNWTG